jgi:hypothetical protein
MKESEKKKLQSTAENLNVRSVSDFIRKVLAEKLDLEEFANASIPRNELIIPDYVPPEKYVAFVNGAVIGVGESPSDVAQIAVEKFPNLPLVIKYNGSPLKNQEYVYASFISPNFWKYAQFGDYSYPVVPVTLKFQSDELPLLASIDTAASLCVLHDGLVSPEDLTFSRQESVWTANGEINATIYTATVIIAERPFDIEFIIAPIASILPFRFLIGRNLLDQLDAYFFGKKQILMLKLAE